MCRFSFNNCPSDPFLSDVFRVHPSIRPSFHLQVGREVPNQILSIQRPSNMDVSCMSLSDSPVDEKRMVRGGTKRTVKRSVVNDNT